jgi:lipopolysaccharide transport system ATP-binding protein
MSKTAIRVDGLSKKYHIGKNRSKYETLRDRIGKTVRKPYDFLFGGAGTQTDFNDEIWALKDLGFELKRGEVLGIIGSNGAGKSTLLKILSRITEPTRGVVDIWGKVGSLLEVGTGFHHELTGRENIFLNAAILGMNRETIRKKFDEIVDFAEVGDFIDTPVKHYSSGMYLKLAFSVAANLEPDILIVDEVLAVGDAAFQEKCLGKMQNVSRQGRTVLFVSHNMSFIQDLCPQSILLNKGSLVYQGKTTDCVVRYLSKRMENEMDVEAVRPRSVKLGHISVNGGTNKFISSEPLKVKLPIAGKNTVPPRGFFIIEDFRGRIILHSQLNLRDKIQKNLDGSYVIELEFPALWLSTGVYSCYFKFINQGIGDTKRFTSERLLIEGYKDPEAISSGRTVPVLTPVYQWKISEGTKDRNGHKPPEIQNPQITAL